MIISSPVIPINQNHIYRHCLASITLERGIYVKYKLFEKQRRKEYPREEYITIRLNNELCLDLGHTMEPVANLFKSHHSFRVTVF